MWVGWLHGELGMFWGHSSPKDVSKLVKRFGEHMHNAPARKASRGSPEEVGGIPMEDRRGDWQKMAALQTLDCRAIRYFQKSALDRIWLSLPIQR